MRAFSNNPNCTRVLCNIAETKRLASYYVPFGINDAKGRAVGCRASITSHLYTESDDPKVFWTCEPELLGMNFAADVHVCRDEKAFGGSSACKWFKSLEEAQAFVAAAIERCRKSNVKKFSAK